MLLQPRGEGDSHIKMTGVPVVPFTVQTVEIGNL